MAIVIPSLCVNTLEWYNNISVCGRSVSCPDGILIASGGAVGGGWFGSRQYDPTNPTTYPGCVSYSNTCGSNDSYCFVHKNQRYFGLNILIWDALRDGQWSSSVSFDVYKRTGVSVSVKPISTNVGYDVNFATKASAPNSSGGTGPCDDTSPSATITIYDDGTVSIA